MTAFASINLRARLALLVASVVSVVVVVVSAVFVHSLQTNLDQAMASKSQLMQDALQRKGTAVARNVALSSSRAIITGNLTFLLEVIETAVSNDQEVVYGILMDRERRALVHSVPALANMVLNDQPDIFAAKQTAVTTQFRKFNGGDVLEVIAPFKVADEPWGMVRLGLSLRPVQNEIAQSEQQAKEQIFLAILGGVGAAVVLLLLGSFFGVAAATALIRPLHQLLEGANRLREGDMETEVVVSGSVEFQTLARAFNDMTHSVKDREATMQDALMQAREANRLKGEFLANVSHELRTPLNAIINVPAALCRDYEAHLAWHCKSCGADFGLDPDAVAPVDGASETCPECGSAMGLETRAFYHGDPSRHYHYLQRTLQSAQHLLAVVTDILDFSKLEAGKMTVHAAPVPLKALFVEVADTVSVLAGAKNIQIVWPRPTQQESVWADSVKLAQILLNLVGNAIKFTPVDGTITVGWQQMPEVNEAQFSVQDNGMGIPADKIGNLFESFRQVDGSHTRAHGGTGLGLAISRKLVDLHGGKIWAESNLGHGSCFSFTIPITDPGKQKGAVSGESGGVRRALVLDDDRMQLELMERFLGEEGFETECLSDYTDAPMRLANKAFNLVIVDVMMPGTSGLTVLKNLKNDAATQNMPVIVSSAYHMNKDLVVSLGGVWLPKPWTQAEFIACVNGAAPQQDPATAAQGVIRDT